MLPRTEATEAHAWWATLSHQGVLISNVVLQDIPLKVLKPLSDRQEEQLRKAYLRFQANPLERVTAWLDYVFEGLLGHNRPQWKKHDDVPDRFKHHGLRPDRILANYGSEYQPRLLIYIDHDHVIAQDESGEEAPGRIGLHRGRNTYAKFVELLRATNVPLGVLTNGYQFRLIYVALDYEAWTEWDARAWFEGGEGRTSLLGFRYLLGAEFNPSNDENKFPLLDLVRQSRERQADLSHVMGTQVREAVEALLAEYDHVLLQAGPTETAQILRPLRRLNLRREDELRALYQAAIRVVMRIVVALYAESRGLFPKDNPVYYDAYSVEGLWHRLRETVTSQGEESLRASYSAWPRLQALGRLIHDGSLHPDLTLPTYNGILFRAPRSEEDDETLAALATLEHPRVRIDDASVHTILDKLKMGLYRVGRSGWQRGVVDFSDLRTEYIGMMYEGLLDYDLREARPEDGGIVFLNLGDQPALPFNVLKSFGDARITQLLGDLGKTGGKRKPEAEQEPEEDDETRSRYDEEPPGESTPPETDDVDKLEGYFGEVHRWARRVVEQTDQFMPGEKEQQKMDPTTLEKAKNKAAAKLILRAVPPGGTYLVRWSGGRKGTGTFYTKPALAYPITMRTLEPLAYETNKSREKVPKTPDVILNLKICDPAMGSGSFLVSAIRYLTTALRKSFEIHVYPRADKGEPLTFPLGQRAEGLLHERLLPIRKEAREGWEERYESQIKRAIVEWCIYGVDINPLAVELGKLSLWIETLDPNLKFTFLDHKIKCGNSLVGAWMDQANVYPLAAWDRQLGDGAHDPRTKRAKRIRHEIVIPELSVYLEGFQLKGVEKKVKTHFSPVEGQTNLFGGGAQQVTLSPAGSKIRAERIAAQTTFVPPTETASWEDVRNHELSSLQRIHEDADPGEQEENYRRLILESEGHKRQKFLLDRWCSVWFWPIRAAEDAPLNQEPLLGPMQFYANDPDESVKKVVNDVAARHRFFHWELEYPEVFGAERFGFDAVLGNPPWDNITPDLVEFFTRFYPAFRAATPKEKPKLQAQLLVIKSISLEFVSYLDAFRSVQHFIGGTGYPFEGKLPKKLAAKWNAITSSLGGSGIGFRHQTDRSNYFKAFAELGTNIVRRKGGCIGLLLPQGIYSQESTASLRNKFFQEFEVLALIGFENRRRIFPIDSRFKFCVLIAVSGQPTKAFEATFFVHDLGRLGEPNWGGTSEVRIEDLRSMSPATMSVPEISAPEDLAIVRECYRASVKLRDYIAPAEAGREYHVSEDASMMLNWLDLQDRQMQVQEDGCARGKKGEVALPVLGGVQIYQFDSNYQRFDHTSRKWVPTRIGEGRMTELWMNSGDFARSGHDLGPVRLVFRAVAQATDARTVLAALVPTGPCVHSLMMLKAKMPIERLTWICAVLNSYPFDFVHRLRQAGANVSWFQLGDAPFPKLENRAAIEQVIKLNWDARWFPANPSWPWLLTDVHRGDPATAAQLREDLDKLIAKAYGLAEGHMRWILRPDNPDPRNLWRDYRQRLKILEANGREGNWYTLEEAREIRNKAGLEVDF